MLRQHLQTLGVRHKVLVLRDLEAQQMRQVGRQQPGPRRVHGQSLHEVRLLHLEQLLERLGGRHAQARRPVDDERLVVFLEVVDGRVLRGGEVDAHCDGVDDGIERLEGRGEGGQVAAVGGAHLGRPGLEALVGRNGAVGGVVDG